MESTRSSCGVVGTPLVERVFRALHRHGVRWCLLRGEEELDVPGGDVDLLVSPADRARVPRILSEVGFVRLPSGGRGSHLFFLGYDVPADRWIKLDVVTELAYGRYQELRTGAEHACLERRRPTAVLTLLDHDDAFWTLLLHCLLDRGAVPERQGRRLQDLVVAARTDGPLARLVGSACPPGWSSARVVAAVRDGDWGALLQLTPSLWAGLPWSRRAVVRGRRAGNRLVRRIARPVTRLRHPAARVTLLAAPDLVLDEADRVALVRRVSAGWPVPVRSVPVRRSRLARPGTGLVARYHRARGRLVLLDRCPCPAPDVVIVLDRPNGRADGFRPESVPAFGGPVAVVHVPEPLELETVRRHLTDALWRAVRAAGRTT